MIDREQAIYAAMRNAVLMREEAESVADAILALPDPVHEAAKPFASIAEELDKLNHSDDSTCMWRLRARNIRSLRTALTGGEL